MEVSIHQYGPMKARSMEHGVLLLGGFATDKDYSEQWSINIYPQTVALADDLRDAINDVLRKHGRLHGQPVAAEIPVQADVMGHA